jgi:hypothetical protein
MYGTRVRFQQTKNQLENHGLAGTTRPDQNGHVSGAHGKGDLVQNDIVIEGQRHLVEEHDWDGTADAAVVAARQSAGVDLAR